MSELGERLEAIIERVTGKTRYHALYRYRVYQDLGATVPVARPDLLPVDTSLGLPTLRITNKAFGAPGLTARLVAGSEVLIAFEAGDVARPMIVAYVPADAQAIEIRTLGKTSVVSPSTIPLPVAPSAVVLMQGLASWASTVTAAAQAIGAWIAVATPLVEPPVVPPGPLANAAAVVVTALGALTSATSSLSGPHPTGAASTKLEAI